MVKCFFPLEITACMKCDTNWSELGGKFKKAGEQKNNTFKSLLEYLSYSGAICDHP